MGFRTGSYAKVWEVTPVDDNKTTLRVSISHKDKKEEGKFIQDFSGYITCRGTVNAKRAAALSSGSNGDTIRIGSSDTTYFYNKEKERGYTTHVVYSFYTEDDDMYKLPYKDFVVRMVSENPPTSTSKKKKDYTDPQPDVDDGEIDDSNLPF